MSDFDQNEIWKALESDSEADVHLTAHEIHALVINSLSPVDAECLQAHLKGCAMCRQDVADHRRQWELEAKEGDRAREPVAVAEIKKKWSWGVLMPAFGAAAVVGACMFVIGRMGGGDVTASKRAGAAEASQYVAELMAQKNTQAGSEQPDPKVKIVTDRNQKISWENLKSESVIVRVYEPNGRLSPIKRETGNLTEIDVTLPPVTLQKPALKFFWEVEDQAGQTIADGTIILVLSKG